MAPSYKSRLWLLIFIATVVRCILAATTELGNDEVYYWTYAQDLQWNYFDHPPMVAIWIKAFTANLSLEAYELFVRLGSIVSAAICTWLIYGSTARIHNERAGWFAACLYTTSLYSSIIAGLFILPDSPQMLFWCAALYLLVRLTETPRSWWLWIGFGAAAGLCIMSKVHGGFLWIGLGMYLLFKRREWLKLPQIYAAALLTAVIISPILLWNMANDFVTYRFHSERVEVKGFSIDMASFGREVFGQVLYNNPFNIAVLVAALVAWKRKAIERTASLTLFAFIGVPMILLLIGVSLFRTTFPHWSGPGHVALLPLMGVYLAQLSSVGMPLLLRGAFITILLVAALGLGLTHFYPGTLGSKKAEKLGHGDFTLDLNGWTAAGKAFRELYAKEVASGAAPKGAPVVAHKWFPAAHLDYYFCRPNAIPLIGLGTATDLHHYLWLNHFRSPKAVIEKAYAIVPSNAAFDVRAAFGGYYNGIDSIATIRNYRSGKATRQFIIYRLQDWKGVPVPMQH
ncbi:MAG: glycosyl transferase family protein [Flaviaesturariibacter sp.]|nr:glycosyl transferase family protein [Flaviaesturariibacter sp.]